MVEVTPQQGLGQSYLPTKAAFQWQADRWVGLITRLHGPGFHHEKHHGTDERITCTVIVPAANPSWGYGLYVRPAIGGRREATVQLTSLKTTNAVLLKALDLGKTYEFSTPSASAVASMKGVLAAP